jgi:hypothetical protein
MASVFGLHQGAARPIELGKNHRVCSKELNTYACRGDTQQGHAYVVTGLEFFDERLAVFRFGLAIDANEPDTFPCQKCL